MKTLVARRLFKRKKLLCTVAGLAVAWLFVWYVLPWFFPGPEGLEHPEKPGAVVLDRDGGRIATLPGRDYYHCEPVPLRAVPEMLVKATLAAEDKRFYSHGGADFLALGRAVVTNAAGRGNCVRRIHHHPAACQKCQSSRQKKSGLKNEGIFSSPASGNDHEQRGDSGGLLQSSGLRQFAPRACGCGRFYFGRDMDHLSLAECALLAGLPQGPSRLNPLNYPDRALERRNRVLRRMKEEGMFPVEMLDRALQEPLFSSGTEKRRQALAPHVTASFLRAFRTGEVHTTLDSALQRGVQEIVGRELANLEDHHVTQAAVVVVENATGDILCLVGSANRKHPQGGLLDGTSMPRSPGSALKPFVYAQAFTLGAYPGTVLPDVPTTYRSAHGLEAPQNYNKTYMGPISIRKALACSQNIPAMRALGSFGGPSRLLKLLKDLGMQGIDGNAPAITAWGWLSEMRK